MIVTGLKKGDQAQGEGNKKNKAQSQPDQPSIPTRFSHRRSGN
jgi:hypothetical protein